MRHSVFSAFASALLMGASPLSAASVGEGDEISSQVIEHADGQRVLVHEVIIDAPPERVWEAFSTESGWKSWGIAFAKMDVRTGGRIESGYIAGVEAGDPRNITHRILAMIPERLMVLRVEKAPQGPVPSELLDQLWAVYELEELENGRTLLKISGHGYGEGPDFDRMIGFFRTANTQSIETMRSAIAAQD